MDTILVVDDDAKFRKFIRRTFEKENIEILEACNGEECISLIEKYHPSVFLVDIVMPGKDGTMTIKEIKSQIKEAKIVAISGGDVFMPESYLEEAELAGADYLLSKPVDRQKLVSTLKKILR